MFRFVLPFVFSLLVATTALSQSPLTDFEIRACAKISQFRRQMAKGGPLDYDDIVEEFKQCSAEQVKIYFRQCAKAGLFNDSTELLKTLDELDEDFGLREGYLSEFADQIEQNPSSLSTLHSQYQLAIHFIKSGTRPPENFGHCIGKYESWKRTESQTRLVHKLLIIDWSELDGVLTTNLKAECLSDYRMVEHMLKEFFAINDPALQTNLKWLNAEDRKKTIKLVFDLVESEPDAHKHWLSFIRKLIPHLTQAELDFAIGVFQSRLSELDFAITVLLIQSAESDKNLRLLGEILKSIPIEKFGSESFTGIKYFTEHCSAESKEMLAKHFYDITTRQFHSDQSQFSLVNNKTRVFKYYFRDTDYPRRIAETGFAHLMLHRDKVEQSRASYLFCCYLANFLSEDDQKFLAKEFARYADPQYPTKAYFSTSYCCQPIFPHLDEKQLRRIKSIAKKFDSPRLATRRLIKCVQEELDSRD